MSKVKVKKEKLATRCEICHQTDKFNPKKNYCKRCYKFNPNQNSHTIANTNFVNKLSKILFFCWKLFLFITIPSFISAVSGFGTICALVMIFLVVGVILESLGVHTINQTIGSIIQTIVFWLVIIVSIHGFVIGIKITFSFFNKPSSVDNNEDLDIPDLENQPYYVNSKNIYS